MEALSERLGVEQDAIQLQSLTAMTWPDAGLGCPGAYAFAPGEVAGFRIELAHAGHTYTYHTSPETLLLCEPGDEKLPEDGDLILLDPVAEALIDMARADLRKRSDAEPELESIMPVLWQDTGLGCSESEAEPREVAGYRIVLRAGEAAYIYHADSQRVIYCPEEAP
jgi:hypothetical protein